MLANRNTVNKTFLSTLATIAITVLSIMIAFYGITAITLSEQAQKITIDAQTSKYDTVNAIRNTNDAIGVFAYTTRPTFGTEGAWWISSEQESNVRDIMSPYWKSNASFSTLTDSYVNSMLGNYSQATIEDESIRDWLSSLNVTRFKASYNLAEFSLIDVIDELYRQFPPPPAYLNESHTVVFVNSNFTNSDVFLSWFQEYKTFYNEVSFTRSRINSSMTGISQAYLDSAVMTSKSLEEIRNYNYTNAFAIQSLGESITYSKAMSNYYISVFNSLNSIYSHGIAAEESIGKYNLLAQQYNSIENSLAFPAVLVSVGLMAVFGVAIPMGILCSAAWFDSNNYYPLKCRKCYRILVSSSLIGFVAGAILGCLILGLQISGLVPPMP